MLKRKSLDTVVRIFHKPEGRRTPDELKLCARFLFKHQLNIKFFRNKTRHRIEELCKVMGAMVIKPNSVVFRQRVRGVVVSPTCPLTHHPFCGLRCVYRVVQDIASHVYVVMDGAVGMYIPEDLEEQSEYDVYLTKLRILILAGKGAEMARASSSEKALDAAKAAANLHTTAELRAQAVKASGDPLLDAGVVATDGSGVVRRDGEHPMEQLSSTVGSIDHLADANEIQWDEGSAPPPPPRFSEMTPHAKWRWALKRIMIGLRAGKFVNLLVTRRREYMGESLVQVRLIRKGVQFGELDLLAPGKREWRWPWDQNAKPP